MTTRAPFGSVVLEHFRKPRNQRALERVSASHEGFNKQCGDRVRIELEIDDNVIRAAAFTANACAICTASASILTERVTGLTVADARAIGEPETLASLGDEVPAGRHNCATLPQQTLQRALDSVRPA
jgi:nitrogen fixation NifU-like protein